MESVALLREDVMTLRERRLVLAELDAAMRKIAQQTPMRPRSALAAGYAAWCVLYERRLAISGGYAW